MIDNRGHDLGENWGCYCEPEGTSLESITLGFDPKPQIALVGLCDWNMPKGILDVDRRREGEGTSRLWL